MRTAIYPGTFDPITLGHIDVIKKGEGPNGSVTNPDKIISIKSK